MYQEKKKTPACRELTLHNLSTQHRLLSTPSVAAVFQADRRSNLPERSKKTRFSILQRTVVEFAVIVKGSSIISNIAFFCVLS